MKNGYQEAVEVINSMIYDGTPEPTTRIRGTVFDQYLTNQLEKRATLTLTNEEIKQRLETLNELERDRQRQEQAIQAGTRKNNLFAGRLKRALAARERELSATILYHAGKQRFEVIW